MGFLKKLIVADRLGVIVDKVFYAPGDFRNPVILVAVVAYSLQIYIDFSAYCDIAIGAAKILGIDLMENFNTPYFATSITDFWRRWHISLTSWLRDYIFTPQFCNPTQALQILPIHQYSYCLFGERFMAWSQLHIHHLGKGMGYTR